MMICSLVLIGLTSASSFANNPKPNAMDNLSKECKADVNSILCEAYLMGVVDGYISSKKKYTSTEPAPNSAFLSRVYSSRVTNERLDSDKPEPACLPANVNKKQLLTNVIAQVNNQTTTRANTLSFEQVLYEELQTKYGC